MDPGTTDTSAAEAALRDAVRRRALALAAGDTEALDRLMHPECFWLTHTGVVLTRDEYVARNTSVVTWRSQEVAVDDLRILDDVGLVTATVRDVLAVDGTDQEFRMRLTMTWLRDPRDGWRLIAAHAGPRVDDADG